MSNLAKLKFRVVSCSSEDNDFPVTELLKHGPQSKGWQSARFQDFPQVIIFQFICPVHIQQLQFLSHQSKISSRIEIFTYMPENPVSIPPLDQFKWKRLGYLSLDNNEKSNFQARELKSVFIDVKALFLKIALNKCHINKYNMFNQVGLVAVNALGEELGDLSAPSRKGLPPRLENELEFDPVTTERLKQLLVAKDRAIENEDFDEAKKLKDAIERLRSVGQQLYTLEERKRIAINNEDYESAKVIKMEIERLRNAILPPAENNNYARPYSGNRPLGMDRPASRPLAGNPIPQSDFDLFPPTKPMKNDPFIKQESLPIRNQIYGNKGPVSHDEQVIPTVASGKNPAQIYEEDDEEGPKNVSNSPEPLGMQQAKLAEPFIHILTDKICKRIFSKTWQFREEGLGIIMNEVSGSSSEIFANLDNPDIYTGTLGAIRHTLGDKVAQVSQKSMGLLGLLIRTIPPNRGYIHGDASEYAQSIMILLLDKAGDNNARVRELAEQTFMAFGKSEIIGISSSIQAILKPSKEKSTSQKHIVGKLNLLTTIVEEFRIDNSSVPFQPVVDYAISSYANSNSEIRNAAHNLLMKIYSSAGTKLSNLISENKVLRPAQIDSLQKGFSEVEVGTYQEPKAAPSKVVRNEREARENKEVKEQKNVIKNVGMCEFCGKTDSIFMNQDNLDIHYWKDCPMLVACPQCSQIVEIIQLNSHMLKECELKELVGQCSRCKEAIHMDEYEQHVEEQACLAAKPASKANRCPLCHDDVDPGQNGWMKHILTEGCPNNDRSNY